MSAAGAADTTETLVHAASDRAVRSLLSGADRVTGPTRPALVRVGVDVVAVEEVALSLEAFGSRYLRRLFTAHERSSCVAATAPSTIGGPGPGPGPSPGPGLAAGWPDRYRIESLAARFAAKEAALKVLRPDGARPEWRSLEVRQDVSGWCELHLAGTAARLARLQGIDRWALSLTHDAGVAVAVVVATGPGTGPS
jgi:holo-[acyl-carrier protein] synthase